MSTAPKSRNRAAGAQQLRLVGVHLRSVGPAE